MPAHPPKLLDQVRDTLRTQHYARSTEQAYLNWIKRFILFHHKQHPQTMNSAEIEAFLTYLAVKQHSDLQPFLIITQKALRNLAVFIAKIIMGPGAYHGSVDVFMVQ
jgi:hypothetical protein